MKLKKFILGVILLVICLLWMNSDIVTAQQQSTIIGDSISGNVATSYVHAEIGLNQIPRNTGIVIGSKPFISILCKFSDNITTPKSLQYFKNMYSSNYPGLDNYWREVSNNNVNLIGSNAVGWYILPHTRIYYLTNSYLYGIAKDCTDLANADVDFSQFWGINIMLNDDVDGYAWGGSMVSTLGDVSKNWPITWLPPWAYGDIATTEHEIGHAFGLSHSIAYGNEYGNQWDVMSDTWSNCENSTNRTFGCLGQSTTAWGKDALGWINGRKYLLVNNKETNILVECLELSTATKTLLVQIQVKDSVSHFFTVETRCKSGYDVKLPTKAVIIHEINMTGDIMLPSSRLVTSPKEMWMVNDTYYNMANNISIKVLSETATGYRVLINNNVCLPSGPCR